MSNGEAEVFALGLEFPPCLFGRGNVDEQPITHQARSRTHFFKLTCPDTSPQREPFQIGREAHL
jgi:hypothetical protein